MSSQRRLVVVSNRVGDVRDTARAGGLAIALANALQQAGGIWYGWSGEASESEELKLDHHGDLTLATLDLTHHELEEYYYGFANRCLWPLFHYRIDLTAFDRRFYSGYLDVNAKFARGLYPLLEDSDILWVHDYHLLALGSVLRALGARQPMGFFLHIPFPSVEVLATLPRVGELVRALCDYDVLGFQTDADRDRFVRFVVREHDAIVKGDVVHVFGRRVIVRGFPIGIDTNGFAAFATGDDANRAAEEVRVMLRGRHQVIGVDRLDYTKGLPERLAAFERLLERQPEVLGEVSFLQIAPFSREKVEEYQQIRETLEGLAGRINGRFAQVDWTPIRYLNRPFSRRELAGLYRSSRVGLVTPLRDGMNLVAKEYVAAQDPEDPGVLVLSRFAGAARQMREAIIVNPYDVDGVAEAIDVALAMGLDERKERYNRLMSGLRRYDLDAWRDDFLGQLYEVADAS